jgi:uncharacterized membrane protein
MDETAQTNQPQSAFSLFRPSMEAVKRNPWTYFWLVFIPSLFSLASNSTKVEDANGSSAAIESWGTLPFTLAVSSFMLVTLAIVFLSLVIAPAVTHLQLSSAKNKDIGVADALKVGLKYVWRYLGLIIVLVLLFVGGLILFIVPGLIVLRRYFLAPYFMLDKDLSIGEAMKQSAAATKPFSGAIWGIIGVYILLSLPGFIPLIGGLVSIALTTLYSVAPALRYYELSKLTSGGTQ